MSLVLLHATQHPALFEAIRHGSSVAQLRQNEARGGRPITPEARDDHARGLQLPSHQLASNQAKEVAPGVWGDMSVDRQAAGVTEEPLAPLLRCGTIRFAGMAGVMGTTFATAASSSSAVRPTQVNN